MSFVGFEWFQIAIGWGYVSAIMTWLVLQWAFPMESDNERDSLLNRDREDPL